MAKVKGGLGKTSLIEDLTRPIRFHISEALEPPPPFERRKGDRDTFVSTASPPFWEKATVKALSLLGREAVQLIFHLSGCDESLLLEGIAGHGVSKAVMKAVMEERGEYHGIPWENSFFANFEESDIIEALSDRIARIEVITGEDFITFSSLDDLREWLEL